MSQKILVVFKSRTPGNHTEICRRFMHVVPRVDDYVTVEADDGSKHGGDVHYIEAIARRWAVMDGKDPDDIELGFVYNKDDPRPRLWECYAEDVVYLLEAITDDWEIVPKGATSGLWVSPEDVSSVKIEAKK